MFLGRNVAVVVSFLSLTQSGPALGLRIGVYFEAAWYQVSIAITAHHMQEPHDAGSIRQSRENPEGATEFLAKGQDSRGEVGMEKLGCRAKTSDVSTRAKAQDNLTSLFPPCCIIFE